MTPHDPDDVPIRDWAHLLVPCPWCGDVSHHKMRVVDNGIRVAEHHRCKACGADWMTTDPDEDDDLEPYGDD